ncbi:MAG: presqualene diphosphate synthase HpnD [Candidatus Kapabacteria bacterium]|nr:presqualene diphosphate synthase HpnD [Candidatus Kapabacteria bacterium]
MTTTDAQLEAARPQERTTNFYYSFSFLPRAERNAINDVYAFCRMIDDIVDLPATDQERDVEHKRAALNVWRSNIESMYAGRAVPAIAQPIARVVERYNLPKQYLLTVIDGCERDLTRRRYQTFAELKEYCYGVAAIVGLISIEVFGYRHEETKQYAINLGYALQLTNILRDIKQDKDRGYIYIPLEDLERFKYSEQDLVGEVYNENFVALMAFQVQRARDHYHRARTMLRSDERRTMVAAQIMDAIYYRLLEKIELHDYRIYDRRISVRTSHKLLTALRVWLSNRLFVQRIKPTR